MQRRQRHSLARPAASVRIMSRPRGIDGLRSRRVALAAVRRWRLRGGSHGRELVRVYGRVGVRLLPRRHGRRRVREHRRRNRIRVSVVGMGGLRAMRAELRVLVCVDRRAPRRCIVGGRRWSMPCSLRIGRISLTVHARLGPRSTRASPSPRRRRSRARLPVRLGRRRRCCRRLRRPISPSALALGPIAMLDDIRLERDGPRRALELLTAPSARSPTSVTH